MTDKRSQRSDVGEKVTERPLTMADSKPTLPLDPSVPPAIIVPGDPPPLPPAVDPNNPNGPDGQKTGTATGPLPTGPQPDVAAHPVHSTHKAEPDSGRMRR